MPNLKIVQYPDWHIDYSFDALNIKEEPLTTMVVSMNNEQAVQFEFMEEEYKLDIVETLLAEPHNWNL